MESLLPIITVGITCHNAADTIERAVKSALDQDWPNLEVIVVDDCSSDQSRQVLETLALSEPKLKVLRHGINKGYPGALNTIINAACGEFVAIFDDDDDNLPSRLRAQYERITDYVRASGAELVFCYANRSVVKCGQADPDHVALAIGRRAPEPNGPAVADFVLDISTDTYYVWGMFGSCTLMARRSAFLTVGPFDESFRRCAEWDMAVRAAFKGAHFIAVDRPLITQYKTQSADKSGALPLKYSLLLREKHSSYLRRRGLYFVSRALARSNFYGSKGRIWVSRAYRLMAMALRSFPFRKFVDSAGFGKFNLLTRGRDSQGNRREIGSHKSR
ncbi:Glycosyltransferase involved in cell wall bisynthesis [Filomicrobium insigne]|uniref:Glycosyltransferase involved in cell wall bisynthesis n=1 Tax=Filomicrobium insigne TaxID=418854 RepID=A0A1H0UAN9_9HYPH|nr:glycosyltransferase family 2 protein [Filomicrobium insigne]SDP63239.1 Glycosyltransferase involved in cell wall bisynthesis [Filomicrobium insigne]